MSGFLTAPWIIPHVLKQLEKIRKEQQITTVSGKFRAQIIRVFEHGDSSHIIELSDKKNSCKTRIPQELMQDYEEERKTYVGLIGAFVLIKKFKFAVENGKLFIILEQFEFCGLQGTPQVGSPTQIGSGKGDYWDEINFFLEFLKETDAIPSVLDHDHAESAVNIENAEIKPLDPPTPLKPVANTLNQKFIGWDNFDLDDDQVSVSIQEQNTLKAIILPPAQVQNSSVTNTIIFPVSTTTAVSGSQALIHSDFDEYDGISDEALLQLELDSQSTQSDDRMIDLVADSDEEERCESDREDEQVQMRITQTKPTIERTRSTSYCSKGLMTKPPYASAESDSEVETVEHPEISSKTTPQEFRIQENACASHHNRSDKAIKTLPVPASFAELSDEELFEDAIDFQTSNGDTMPKQAKFTELSDEELFEDALGEDRVEGEQDKEDQKMSQPQSIEMLDLFSQSPTSQKIHISQSDHGDDLFTQNEFKVIETSAAFIPEESDDPKAAVQPLLASTVETVKMPGVEAPVEHSAENDFDEIAADRADGIFPAKHMEIDKNEEVAAGTPKVANNHLINEEPEVNGLTAISVPNAESFAVKQVNPFEDPENEDKPDFKSDEEEDAEASPTSPSLSSKSDSEAELLEALVDFDGITEDNYAQEKIVNAFQESVCLDSYLSQEHQTEIPDFISQVVSLESISNEDFKLVMDYSQDGNEEFRNTTQACCLLTQEISDSMPYSKLLESDEKMESKIERTEVVVESQLEVEKVTEVFLGLNNGTVIEESDVDMEISSSIAETADLYKQNTESESDDFEELISRTFEKIFPAKDGPDPMLDSFFSDARGSPDPDDLDFNPKYSNILPLPAVALTEQEENFEYLGEVDKENVININSNLEMNSKPHGFKSNLNLLRKSIILSSELDVKTTQDQESEAESEPSQHSQSQIGTQFTPQRFKCFQELEIDNTTPAQHLDVNNTISNGPLRSLKNDLFVKVVTSQASIRLSNPSLSISSSGQSEFPPASLPMSQTQSADPVTLSRRKNSSEKLARLSLGMKKNASYEPLKRSSIGIIFPSRRKTSLSSSSTKRQVQNDDSVGQKRRRTDLWIPVDKLLVLD